MRARGFALALALATPALAVDEPQGSRDDNRIQRVPYNDDGVVSVHVAEGRITRLVFEPGEVILDHAAGFEEGWRLQPSANVPHTLYISARPVPVGSEGAIREPEPEKWRTNIMVVTDRRQYDFDLHLVEPDDRGGTALAYRIEFTYPGERAQAARAATTMREDRARTEAALAGPASGGLGNTDYSRSPAKGSAHIVPSLAYDDGRFTYFRFPGNREFPSVFVVNPDGEESALSPHVDENRPDVLVITRVAQEFRLRLGKAVVAVYNENFDPRGVPPENGTTVDGVERVLVGSER